MRAMETASRPQNPAELTMTTQPPSFKGASFFQCALQVNPHSYAERHRGKKHEIDEHDYNLRLLAQCRERHIKIVGLANHGDVDGSESLRSVLTEGNITVFPGFEIASSEKIHMVCLYPKDTPATTLNQYLGALMGDNTSRLRDHPQFRIHQELLRHRHTTHQQTRRILVRRACHGTKRHSSAIGRGRQSGESVEKRPLSARHPNSRQRQ